VSAAIDAEADRIFREARREGRRESPAAYAADALVRLVTRGPRNAPQLKLTVDLAPLERGWVEPGERCAIDGFGPVPGTVGAGAVPGRVGERAREGRDRRHSRGQLAEADDPAAVPPAARARLPGVRERRLSRRRTVRDRPHRRPRDNGLTVLENLWRLCKHCHRLKTYFGWTVHTDDVGRRRLVAPQSGRDPPAG